MSVSQDKTIPRSNSTNDSNEDETIFSITESNSNQTCDVDVMATPLELSENIDVKQIAQEETQLKAPELLKSNESLNHSSSDQSQRSILYSNENKSHTEDLVDKNVGSESNEVVVKGSQSEVKNSEPLNFENTDVVFHYNVVLDDDEDKAGPSEKKKLIAASDTDKQKHKRDLASNNRESSHGLEYSGISERPSITQINVDSDNLLQEVAPPEDSHSNDQFSEEETKNSDSESSDLSQEICKQANLDIDDEFKETDTSIEIIHEVDKEIRPDENTFSSENKLKPILNNDLVLKNLNEVSVSADVAPCKNDKNSCNLDFNFLKRFKKSIETMSKQDLEELILQKIVEAIVYRTDLSDLREIIDKQDKMISSHRIKISELTKQFRDLEMVHNRVVKDLEQKTEQFVMPVKITRAVGLQVLIPKRAENFGNATTKSLCQTDNNLSSQGQSLVTFHNPSENLKRAHDVEFSSQESLKRMRCNQKVTPLRPGTLQKPAVSKLQILANKNSIPSINEHQQLQTVALHSNRQLPVAKAVRNSQPPTSQTITTSNQIPFKQQLAPVAKTNIAQSNKKLHPSKFGVQQQNTGQKFTKSLDVRTLPVAPKKVTTSRSLPYDGQQTVASSSYSKANEDSHANKKSIIDLTAEDEKPAEADKKLVAVVGQPQAAKSTFLQPQGRVATYIINKSNGMSQRSTIPSNGRGTQKAVLGSRPSSCQIVSNTNLFAVSNTLTRQVSAPAPLPAPPLMPSEPSWKAPPPRPTIRINNIDSGIVISWTMDDMSDEHADITSYQIYAYQEALGTPQIEAWRHVGDVKAMLLPMAVTLTQFQEGQRYFFAVRAIDIHSRFGSFSIPKTWS